MIRASLVGIVTALLVTLLLVGDLPAAEPAVSLADVLAMQARIPNCEIGCTETGAYATAGDALAVAKAIAHAAKAPHDAALAALYAAWESANRKRARGDRGLARGIWQLHADPAIADDPERAVFYWFDLARRSRALCHDLPEPEQLAALVSGSCERGRALARRRDEIARGIERAPADLVSAASVTP